MYSYIFISPFEVTTLTMVSGARIELRRSYDQTGASVLKGTSFSLSGTVSSVFSIPWGREFENLTAEWNEYGWLTIKPMSYTGFQNTYVYAFGFDGRLMGQTQSVLGTRNDDVLADDPLKVMYLSGWEGNDTYVVTQASTQIREREGEGVDTVKTSLSYALPEHLENLVLTGTAAINGTGNALKNVLTGNAADNVLDGREGADSMAGGAGNDTYVVDNVGDLVTELLSAGTADTVKSSVSYAIGSHVEHLVLTGTGAIHGTGNTGNNKLTGNGAANALGGGAGADTLDGGAGADTLSGGSGNDRYLVDNGNDQVVEKDGEGSADTIVSTVSYSLPVHVENLSLGLLANGSAPAINGTGNTLNNVLLGNSAANSLSGGAGNDSLSGAGGRDALNGGSGSDELSGGPDADLFQYTAWKFGEDRLTDFKLRDGDRLDLRACFPELAVSASNADDFMQFAVNSDDGTADLQIYSPTNDSYDMSIHFSNIDHGFAGLTLGQLIEKGAILVA